ncbi:MAG: hypothetical protein J1F63_09590 [Oscillospiraceae bacterium]|nr:hypothetical protein [Oscillospiraceae bacterium]
MNSNRELELGEIKIRLEEIRDELESIAENERFSLGYDASVSEQRQREAELAVFSVDEAASHVDEAIEFIGEALSR